MEEALLPRLLLQMVVSTCKLYWAHLEGNILQLRNNQPPTPSTLRRTVRILKRSRNHRQAHPREMVTPRLRFRTLWRNWHDIGKRLSVSWTVAFAITTGRDAMW